MPDQPTSPPAPRGPNAAQRIFKDLPKEQQALIREVLREERDVQHMLKRTEIYVRLYDHIRRLIK